MEINELQRERNRDEERSVAIGLKTSKKKAKWMKANNISPTKVFNTALDELMDGE